MVRKGVGEIRSRGSWEEDEMERESVRKEPWNWGAFVGCEKSMQQKLPGTL